MDIRTPSVQDRSDPSTAGTEHLSRRGHGLRLPVYKKKNVDEKCLGVYPKNVCAVYCVNESAELVQPKVAREKLRELIACLSRVIGMKSCLGAHYWVRLFLAASHSDCIGCAEVY